MMKKYLKPITEEITILPQLSFLSGSGGASDTLGGGDGDDNRTDEDITGGNGDALAPGFNGLIDDEED